jgi:hypothetical protein
VWERREDKSRQIERKEPLVQSRNRIGIKALLLMVGDKEG